MSANNVEKKFEEIKKGDSKTLHESGCAGLYKKVQRCVDMEKEWITCMPEIYNFRSCLLKYKKETINKKAEL